MSLRSLAARGFGLVCVAWLAVTACGDARRAQISRQAKAWTDRMLDTATVDSVTSAFSDSAWVDSVSSFWTTDDWLYFWSEVEKERAARK